MSSSSSNILLSLGCALIAFSPLITMFSIVIYSKAQLVIVVTTSAFFFLLSVLGSGFIWWCFYKIHLDIWVASLIPGVICQFIGRCLFVNLYHKVERVIRISIENDEDAQINSTSDNGTDQTVNGNHDNRQTPSRNTNNVNPATITTEHGTIDDSNWSAAAKLRLQLNDASCGIAAGIGYGGMHTIMFYGTLLSSQMDNVGVLYQSSCPNIPGLVHTAIYAFCFAIFDIFWMLLTFFGMRRRLLYHRGHQYEGDNEGEEGNTSSPIQYRNSKTGFGAYFGNSRSGGNLALLLALVTHFGASLITLSSEFHYGCTFSLPLIFAILAFTIYGFWAGVSKIYMPPENTNQSISLTASRGIRPARNNNNNNTPSVNDNSTLGTIDTNHNSQQQRYMNPTTAAATTPSHHHHRSAAGLTNRGGGNNSPNNNNNSNSNTLIEM